jgi:hypothetical protein
MANGTFSFNTRSFFNPQRIQQNLSFAQMALDQQVLKDANYFIPFYEGILRDSAINASSIGEGRIVWNTPYARRLYYNPQFNFSKDRNPNARGLWFESAKAQHKSSWIQLAEQAVRMGHH